MRAYQHSFFLHVGLAVSSIVSASLSAGCSDKTADPHGVGSGATGPAGGSGGVTTGGTTSAGSGGTTIITVPPGGSGGMATGGTSTGPTGLPADFTPATIGGYKVGDPITDTTQPPPMTEEGCGSTILAVIRDFQTGYPNFETPALTGRSTDDRGVVSTMLGTDQKPVYANGTTATVTISDPAAFDTFFRNTTGTNQAFVFFVYFAPNAGVSTFSSTAFYPLDGLGFGNEGNDDQGTPHNFHFTTEIHTSFRYQGGEIFSFTGDDDVWVFINNQLVIDIGGVHEAESASVSVDTLGLTLGQVYPFDMFQTERHTTQSNFRADTNLAFVNCGTIVR
jgi:fibro-slime domain-containing protein